MTIKGNPITLEGGNNATGNGGAICELSPQKGVTDGLYLTNVHFAGNQALNGGAIYCASGTGAIEPDQLFLWP